MDREQRYIELYILVSKYLTGKERYIKNYDTEDLIQDVATFLLPKLVGKEVNDNYIYKAVENYIKRLRSKVNRELPTVSLDVGFENGETFHDVVPSEDIMMNTLLKMKWQGMSNRRIAEIMGVSERTVNRRIKKYKEEL